MAWTVVRTVPRGEDDDAVADRLLFFGRGDGRGDRLLLPVAPPAVGAAMGAAVPVPGVRPPAEEGAAAEDGSGAVTVGGGPGPAPPPPAPAEGGGDGPDAATSEPPAEAEAEAEAEAVVVEVESTT